VRGVARARGRLATPHGALRTRRLAVVAGHALLEVTGAPAAAAVLRRALARVGEPVLGDERHGHAPSNRHLFERAGLDRCFLHVAGLRFTPPGGAAVALEAALAPDLAQVLARLGGGVKALLGPA
jgi:23S rRNA (uracil1939-C5)-methyltransferase